MEVVVEPDAGPERSSSRVVKMAAAIGLASALAIVVATALTDDGSGSRAEVAAARSGDPATIVMARADWSTGYFQAAVYRQLVEELGYEVTDPAELELGPSIAYLSMAQGDFDFWVNSWYPSHFSLHSTELADGSEVGDHIEIVGEELLGGGLQGYLISKSFADEYGITHLDQINDDPAILAAFDASDPIPDDGKAQIYGCQQSWTCDDVISNQIAFSRWSNIEQLTLTYEVMSAEAVSKVNAGEPMVIYSWTPSANTIGLRPGENVYWLAVDEVIDDSNPADLEGGESHSQLPGVASLPAAECPAARDEPGAGCRLGWVPADITVTANSAWLSTKPDVAALLRNIELTAVDVSVANVAQLDGFGGDDEVNRLAARWISTNRAKVDTWLRAARNER